MIKAGSFTHPGSSSFDITGLPIKPQWVVMMATNLGSENAWQSGTGLVVGSLGFAAKINSQVDEDSLIQANYHEIWESAGVGGIWLGNNILYLQTARDAPVDGWTLNVNSFLDDGFSLGSSITGGAAGKRIYYYAGDEDYEEVGAQVFIPGSSYYSLGWEPQAFFGVGYGGGLGNPDYNTGNTDLSLPTVVAGDWGEYTSSNLETNGVWRGITDPNPDIQFWMGNDVAGGNIPILEPLITTGVFFSSEFAALRTATSFLGNVFPSAGFGNGDARMKNMILGNVDSVVGAFTPSGSGGHIDLPFAPDGVFFASPQEDRAGVSSQAVQGATGWGWCTEEDQGLTLWGGHWNPPDPFQAAGYISSDKCWVSNCLDIETMGTVGTEVTMGSAVVDATGFEYTVTEDNADSGEKWPVLYWALAPKEEAPGFFRRV